jgi:hypothetical protein
MKQSFLSRLAMFTAVMSVALGGGSSAYADTLANPFGKGAPVTEKPIVPPKPVAPSGSALQLPGVTAAAPQAKAASDSVVKSSAAIAQTKRYVDYEWYPVGTDQRNLLAIAELYTGVLRRVPDVQSLSSLASSLNPNTAGLENAARTVLSTGFPQFLTTTDYQYRRSVIWSIYWYAADIAPGTALPYGVAVILDSMVYEPNMPKIGVLVSNLLAGLSSPSYPRFENRVSLALILGWEEQYPIYWDTTAFNYVTNDYQTVLDYAATH